MVRHKQTDKQKLKKNLQNLILNTFQNKSKYLQCIVIQYKLILINISNTNITLYLFWNIFILLFKYKLQLSSLQFRTLISTDTDRTFTTINQTNVL